MTTGIKNSVSFLSWVGGKTAKLVPAHKAVDKDGIEFEAPQSVALIDNEGKVAAFAAFSSNLEAMTASELCSEARNLNVVQLESGTYKICRPGEGSWETLAL